MSYNETRKVTTFFTAADESEPEITLTVEPEDRFTARVVDDLDEIGVPANEQPSVRERAVDLYWQAERTAYLRSSQAERDGA